MLLISELVWVSKNEDGTRPHVSLSSRLALVPFRVVMTRVPRTAGEEGLKYINGFQVTTCFIFAIVSLATASWTEYLCLPQFVC